MKTKKLLLTTAVMLAVLGLGANRTTEIKPESSETFLQCGVSNGQIADYLYQCSHHHTVVSVSDIPGTCNSLAVIENCGTATVYVSEGSIVGHIDRTGICSE